MKKTLLLNLLILTGLTTSFAQTRDIKDMYADYTMNRMVESKSAETIDQGLALLKRSSELNEKQIANINYHVGRLYETGGNAAKAVPYYETVTKLVPGYYVVQLALGYINLKKCDTLGRKVAESAKLKDAALNERSYKAYKAQVTKTIAYFEKAESCEPDERTLGILTTLYKSIKDTTSLSTISSRLASLPKDCVTLLDDE